YNLHTGEYLTTTFWADGQYQDEDIQALDLLLRDHRANQAMAMQRELYEKMFHLRELCSSREPLYVISGYRSPGTNSGLRPVSDGVAENSPHMQGRAGAIRIPGLAQPHLHTGAIDRCSRRVTPASAQSRAGHAFRWRGVLPEEWLYSSGYRPRTQLDDIS